LAGKRSQDIFLPVELNGLEAVDAWSLMNSFAQLICAIFFVEGVNTLLFSFLFFSFRFVSFLLLFLVSCEGLEESSVICGMLGYFCFGFFCHQHNENQIKKYENSSPVSAFSTRYLNNTLSLCMISSFR